MATDAKWDRHNVTDLIRAILRDVPVETQYGTGRPFLTTYQIAIEFAQRYENIVEDLGFAGGGEGEGPYALPTYIARWLPDRIFKRGVADIEMRYIAPNNLTRLEFNDNGTPRVATTNRAGFNSTMFRLVDAPES